MTKKRQRTFPIQPDSPADDSTLIYKIFTQPFEGSYLVIGETVFLSDEGIEIAAPIDADYQDQNAYTFRDENAYQIGGLYGQDNSGENIIAVRAVDPSGTGDDITIEVETRADPEAVSTSKAKVRLLANRSGEEENTYITIIKDDNSSVIRLMTSQFVQLKPKLKFIGAGAENCLTYIKGTNFIIKYDDAGTTRYKYLDLSGSGTTWTHSTSEPV